MAWIKCLGCGNEEFKISTGGSIYCARCMKQLKMRMERVEIKEPYPQKPIEPPTKFPSHPDIPGPHVF
jgi:uncharacterized Zn finger protein (UPF0148 family)